MRSQGELSPVMLSRWKAEFLERATMVFGRETKDAEKLKKDYEAKKEQLEQLVGQLTVEVNWLKKNMVSKTSVETSDYCLFTILPFGTPATVVGICLPGRSVRSDCLNYARSPISIEGGHNLFFSNLCLDNGVHYTIPTL